MEHAQLDRHRVSHKATKTQLIFGTRELPDSVANYPKYLNVVILLSEEETSKPCLPSQRSNS